MAKRTCELNKKKVMFPDECKDCTYLKPRGKMLCCSYKPGERQKAMQAYCVKCRAKKEIKDAKSITMKNGRPATQGVCPTCGTKMFRIGKS